MKLFSTLILALSASPALAGVSFSVTATDTTLKDLSALNLKAAVETSLNDGVVVGGTYDYNAAKTKPDEVYVKKAFPLSVKDFSLGDLALDARYKLEENKALLTATLQKNSEWIKASFNSKSILDKVSASTTVTFPGSRNLVITPTYFHNNKDFEVELEQDIQAGKTKAFLTLKHAEKDAVLTVEHKVDDRNTIAPTLSSKKGYLTYAWKHALEGGGSLKATVDPHEDVNVEWADPGKFGGWVTKANVPIKEPRTATLSFKRKFSIA